MNIQQAALFETSDTIPNRNREWFLSISYDQNEILRAISILHNGGKPFECDPTYSKGVFYRNFPPPRLRFDLYPQSPDVQQADCRALPLPDDAVNSIMFDPPFVIGDPNQTGIVPQRFRNFKNYNELELLYRPALQEFYRVLKPNGLLVFKCQDTIACAKQNLTHVDITCWAQELGFYAKDLFILLNTNLLMDNRWKNQQHARKAHSYFLVFVKQEGRPQ